MLIYRGAEAELYREDFCGIDSVRKVRVRKKYLEPKLDERLRLSRLRNEARMLARARKAVNTPHVLFVGEDTLVMEYIGGETVKEAFMRGDVGCAEMIGREIRKLHGLGIVHNDLTTSNLLLRGGGVYFVDFGLAHSDSSLEGKAVDLVVFKHMLSSTHYGVFDAVWPEVLKGYGTDGELTAKMAEIESRAKYR